MFRASRLGFCGIRMSACSGPTTGCSRRWLTAGAARCSLAAWRSTRSRPVPGSSGGGRRAGPWHAPPARCGLSKRRGDRRHCGTDPARGRCGRRGLRGPGLPLVRQRTRVDGDRTSPATGRGARGDLERGKRISRPAHHGCRRASRPHLASRLRVPARHDEWRLGATPGTCPSPKRPSTRSAKHGWRILRPSTHKAWSPTSAPWAGSQTFQTRRQPLVDAMRSHLTAAEYVLPWQTRVQWARLSTPT